MLLAATSMLQSAELLAIGAAAGLIGGLFGIGGGIIMIPGMVFVLGDRYGPESLHVFKLASLAASVALSLPASLRHARQRATVAPILRTTTPLAIVGAVAGLLLAQVFLGERTRIIQAVFGVFLLLVAAWDVVRSAWLPAASAERPAACPAPSSWRHYGLLVGLPSGLLAGFLGIGGGVWAVPAQTLLLGVALRNAIANATATIVYVAAVCVLAKSAALALTAHVNPLAGWWLALWLAPGAIAGGWFGAVLVHRLPVGRLRLAFDALLIFSGVRMLL